MALDKLECLQCCLTFLEFELDTSVRDPSPRPKTLGILQSLLQDWLHKRSCIKRELKSLVGKRAHASAVVPPGKTFMRRMFELLRVAQQAHHHIRLGSHFTLICNGGPCSYTGGMASQCCQHTTRGSQCIMCGDRYVRQLWLWGSVSC